MDIVTYFKDKAEQQGWHFVYGKQDDINYQLTKLNIVDGANIFILTELSDAQMVESGGKLTGELRYNVVYLLGRKTENGITTSKLDETLDAKHRNRLQEMIQTSILFNRRLFCAEGRVSNVRITQRLNRYSSNIDVIAVQMTIEC